MISVPDTQIVFKWREQAEKKLREEGQGAMTQDEVRAFVARFMPSYGFPQGLSGLKFMLDENRKPII